jgi:hypothetical protein
LARRGGEADIAVGGGALALLDDLDAADLRIGEQPVIPVGEDQHVHAGRFEIAAVVEHERRPGLGGGRCGGGGERGGGEQGRQNACFHAMFLPVGGWPPLHWRYR